MTESESTRLVWAASFEGPPEEWGASALTLDGEVVFINLAEAPSDLPPFRDGRVTAYLDSTAADDATIDRLSSLCATRHVLLYYMVWPDRPSLEPLARVVGLRELHVDNETSEPIDVGPVANIESLETLWLGDPLDRASLLLLGRLEHLTELTLSEETSCELARLRSEMPETHTIANHLDEVPCPDHRP